MSNMENKLATIQRENVSKLMEVMELSRVELCKYTGLSSSTFGNSFRLSKAITDPSRKSLDTIYRTFGLDAGILDIADAVTKEVEFTIPSPIVKNPLTTVHLKIGTTIIETQITSRRAKELLTMLILGEEIE